MNLTFLDCPVIEIREESHREALEEQRKQLLKSANQLTRLSRECQQNANDLFDQADALEKQMEALS